VEFLLFREALPPCGATPQGRPARSILARSIWIVDVSFSWRQRAGFCEYPTPPRNHPLVALIFLWRLPLVDGYHYLRNAQWEGACLRNPTFAAPPLRPFPPAAPPP